MKRTFLLILISLAGLLCACGERERISYAQEMYTDEEDTALDLNESKASFHASVYVYVAGCVANPGVYIMPEGSRVYDAINAAGGVTEEGDESRMNLVNIIHDGDRITVPEYGSGGEKSDDDGARLVNINSASVAQLTTVPGIGEAKAKAIIAYREKHGSFSRKEDIMKVSGIKEGTFEKIKDYIEAY
ncbi:MAG: helix-hairpin-helix domain-containing protein [Lachnospiraceae bacterium]|nr:helix-hairpin-helix domain-containing protein [Lachnospiraceae bacterium]